MMKAQYVNRCRENTAGLDERELMFLARYGLSVEQVFDGRGWSQKACRVEAKSQGKTLVLGSPCHKSQHRLRTRAGHCAQCDPKKMAYEARHFVSGYVYIAGSKRKQFIKIGSTGCIDDRKRTLRNQYYAGAWDWNILAWIRVVNSGSVEHDVSKSLSASSMAAEYLKDGRVQVASEIFRCTYTVAREALLGAVEISGNGVSNYEIPTHCEGY